MADPYWYIFSIIRKKHQFFGTPTLILRDHAPIKAPVYPLIYLKALFITMNSQQDRPFVPVFYVYLSKKLHNLMHSNLYVRINWYIKAYFQKLAPNNWYLIVCFCKIGTNLKQALKKIRDQVNADQLFCNSCIVCALTVCECKERVLRTGIVQDLNIEAPAFQSASAEDLLTFC